MPANEIPDIKAAMDRREQATITMWNRLESRARTDDFSQALRAEIRDPLWLLSRQWQLGEFRASDGGSPVLARYQIRAQDVRSVGRDADRTEARSVDPIDPLVERRPIPRAAGTTPLAGDLALAIGRRWAKLLRTNGLGQHVAHYVAAYGFAEPLVSDPAVAPTDRQAAVLAHGAERHHAVAVGGKAIDGLAFLHRIGDAAAGLAVDSGTANRIRDLATELERWYRSLISEPDPESQPGSLWSPAALEYGFDIDVGAGDAPERKYGANGYLGDGIDWYSTDLQSEFSASEGPETKTSVGAVVPAPVTFAGMPNRRWWEMEDAKINFASIDSTTTDLGLLLLTEFALVYSNDWFLIPVDTAVGAVCDVRGLVVTDTFGVNTLIRPSGSGPARDWERWTMFTNSRADGASAADTRLSIPSRIANILEGEASEEALLLRDEVSNVVWAIETVVPMPSGATWPGRQVAREIEHFLRPAQDQPALRPERASRAPVRYQLDDRMPRNWIPFIAVRDDGQERNIRLQRAALTDAQGNRVTARTSIIRENTDGALRFVDEEAATPFGVRLSHRYRRIRNHDGTAVVWLAATRRPGRSDVSESLLFDQIVEQSPPDDAAG